MQEYGKALKVSRTKKKEGKIGQTGRPHQEPRRRDVACCELGGQMCGGGWNTAHAEGQGETLHRGVLVAGVAVIATAEAVILRQEAPRPNPRRGKRGKRGGRAGGGGMPI